MLRFWLEQVAALELLLIAGVAFCLLLAIVFWVSVRRRNRRTLPGGVNKQAGESTD